MRRIPAVIAALLAAGLLGCGTGPAKTRNLPPSVKHACPGALGGEGSMGVCNPNAAVSGIAARASSTAGGGLTFPDFSNNDPCYCAVELKTHRHVGEIDKANQGTAFRDSTFAGMVRDAYTQGLAVGGYDFDQLYTADETYVFVSQLEAAGIHRNTPRTFPPTLDVEFGLSSRAGLEHQLAVLFRVYGRAQIYTGAWYWLPHFGCWIPPHVSFWLSGYPVASLLCGLNPGLWLAHQYTDHGYTGAGAVPYSDMSVFLGTSSQFAAFTHTAPAALTHRELQEQLWRAYRERTGVERRIALLSALLTKHGCRPPHHATPRSYRREACPTWKAQGDASHRHLTALQAQINAFHTKGIR